MVAFALTRILTIKARSGFIGYPVPTEVSKPIQI